MRVPRRIICPTGNAASYAKPCFDMQMLKSNSQSSPVKRLARGISDEAGVCTCHNGTNISKRR